MNSREKILQAVRRNQPAPAPLPPLDELAGRAAAGFSGDPVARFTEVLTGIGGQVVLVNSTGEVVRYIREHYADPKHRVITTLPALAAVAEVDWHGQSAHRLADAELAVIQAHFGVVENGAVWLTEPQLLHRATPFIAQHLGVLLRATDLVPTMHEAYARIGGADYHFGVFVAGPSKTADIEQSLVLGAHGPKTMTVFLVG
jgi:L-lactate dehydrogenase complex protein LldG